MSRAPLLATVFVVGVVGVVGFACKREPASGLPPAREWTASKDPAPEAVAPDQANPHGDQANPHGDAPPAAAPDVTNPHGGVANVGDPSNPHGGMGGMTAPTAPRSLDKLPDGRLVLGPFTFKLPDGWTVKPVTSSMRAADLQMGSDAEMVVYYFGDSGAGSIQDNLERWTGQFAQPDGKPSKDVAKVSAAKVAGQDATLVSVAGKFGADSMMAGQASSSIPDAELLAAIVASPRGPYYFKGVGNRTTMEANLVKWKGMLASFVLQ
jgi:hypothetical protein